MALVAMVSLPASTVVSSDVYKRQGFENISGDIMLALPHYTQAEFDETLELIEEGGGAVDVLVGRLDALLVVGQESCRCV